MSYIYLAKMTMEQQFPTSPMAPTTSKSSPSVSHGNHSNPNSMSAVPFESGAEVMFDSITSNTLDCHRSSTK